MSASGTRKRFVRRILRVNHAGEQGAISIYGAQIALARARYPDLLPWLQETLGHVLLQYIVLMTSGFERSCSARFCL